MNTQTVKSSKPPTSSKYKVHSPICRTYNKPYKPANISQTPVKQLMSRSPVSSRLPSTLCPKCSIIIPQVDLQIHLKHCPPANPFCKAKPKKKEFEYSTKHLYKEKKNPQLERCPICTKYYKPSLLPSHTSRCKMPLYRAKSPPLIKSSTVLHRSPPRKPIVSPTLRFIQS